MLQPNTLINQRYQIVHQVGQGGFGFVYEAIDTRLDKPVALKQTRFTDPQRRQTFEREARLLALLRHPRLPQVTDHFSDASGQFLVMEFIPGDDLGTLLDKRGGPFPLADVLQWADQLLDILEYLHSQRPPVLHYDIKPQNLKLARDGSLMLLDFGLAKTSESRASGFSDNYSPFEQIEGTGTDARADLYAVGATLYHLLVGTPPPSALTRSAAVYMSGSGKPDPLLPPHAQNRAIPPAVSAALVHALSIKPADRPASATELRALLQAATPPGQGPSADAARQGVSQPPFVGGTPTVLHTKGSKPPWVWIAVGALMVVLLGASFLIGRGAAPAVAPPSMAMVNPTTAVAPTVVRTVAPTVAPTVVPTLAPTLAPTVAPTVAPTLAPAATGKIDEIIAGAELFGALPNGQISCSICHNIAPGSGVLVGPSLSGIGATAATRVPRQTAEQYIRNSILTPSAYVVTGFTDGLMPQTFSTELTPQEVEDLVAYLLILP